MNHIPINHQVSAQLKRSSRRRSIGIKVHRGQVVVSAPLRAPLGEIHQFVAQKTSWIEKHLDLQRRNLRDREERQLEHGTALRVLGESLTLEVSTVARAVRREGDLLHLGGELPRRKLQLGQWLAVQALAYLPGRIAVYAPLLGVQPSGIRVRHYKSRWGSCNRRGELQFNWLLMLAQPAVVDYVVIHELAHLRHFNHSPAFWHLVASVMPDYAEHRAWLKKQTSLVW